MDSLTAELESKAGQPEEKAESDGGGENRIGKKQNRSQPGAAKGRLNYTLGGLTVTLPAKIRYDQGDLIDGKRFFTDTESDEDAEYVFIGMEIEIGVDLSFLDEAMMNAMLGSIRMEVEKQEEIRNPRFEYAEILGYPALNVGFSTVFDGGEAPGYGTIIVKGESAYVLYYSGLGPDMETIKAEMLECLATIREN